MAAVDFTAPEISLPRCSIDATIVEELCDVLTLNESVGTLNFERNELGDDGAEHVAKLIGVNKGIVGLNLSHNGITDAGAVMLARAARRHGTLQSLNLAGNPISDAGVNEIARLVHASEALRELVLLDTEMTMRGALGLIEAMVVNHSLSLVSLPYSLGFTVLDEVQRILTRNFAQQSGLDQQVKLAAATARFNNEKLVTREQQWKPTQPKAEPPTSRTNSVKAALADWGDAVQRPSLMFLSLLDKKSKLVESEERRQTKLEQSPRGRGLASLSPRAMSSVRVIPGSGSARQTPSALSASSRGSAGASRFVS